MKLIQAVNNYFIAPVGESAHIFDYIWFYGFYTIAISVTAIVILF